MLSTKQSKLVSSPRGRLLHQRGFMFSLAPKEEAPRTGGGLLGGFIIGAVPGCGELPLG